MGAPPAPRTVNPRVPEALSALVARAVEHDGEKRLPTLDALRDGLDALVDAGGAEWEAPVFAPTASTPAEGAPAPGRARRRKVAAAGVVVAAAAAFALLREPSPPPEAPHLPAPGSVPHARAPDAPPPSPPSPTAPPAAEIPLPAPMAPAQKDSPTVSAPKPPPRQPLPKQPRPAPRPTFTPEFLAKCAGLTLTAQVAAGCPAPQVRPEREECPAEAVEFMRRLDVPDNLSVGLVLDVNQPGHASDEGVYRTGKYMGAMQEDAGLIKEGWRVEGYIWTEGEWVVGRYTKLFPPAGAKDEGDRPLPREVPVCLVLGFGREDGLRKDKGSKPGAVVLARAVGARFIFGEWTQP
jgi:serine/threonine-protein kinase